MIQQLPRYADQHTNNVQFVSFPSSGSIHPNQATKNQTTQMWDQHHLRTPFLERYVTIYDRVFLRVGIAFAVHATEPTGETTGEAQQRLMGRKALGGSAPWQQLIWWYW